MGRVTLQTIAERLGVSRMTVSNAFSRPDQLSEELRNRILSTAQEMGYVGPDPAARALARGTSGAIGVLLTDSLRVAFTDQVATEFLGAIVDELAPTGLALTLLTAYGKGDVVPARDVAMDGALVYSCDTASQSREWLMRRKLPVVFVDQEPEPDISSVNVDDRGGARAAAQHLVDLGHREIGIINSAETTEVALIDDPLHDATAYPSHQRMLGWLDALSPAGIVPTVVQTPKLAAEGAGDVPGLLLLEASPRPTAILCFSDVLALGVVHTARKLGLAVPQDLSVIGFDDSLAARFSDPSLTTVRQDVEAKGRTAAAALVDAIESARIGTSATPQHHVLPTELVVRESTAPPPAASSAEHTAPPATSARHAR